MRKIPYFAGERKNKVPFSYPYLVTVKLDRRAISVNSGGMGFFKPNRYKIILAIILFPLLFIVGDISITSIVLEKSPVCDVDVGNFFLCTRLQQFILVSLLLPSLVTAYPLSCIVVFLVKKIKSRK